MRWLRRDSKTGCEDTIAFKETKCKVLTSRSARELHVIYIISIDTFLHKRTRKEISRTISIVLVREIRPVSRTRNKSTPERPSILSFLQSWNINLSWHIALFEQLLELFIVDVIIVEESYQDSKIVVSV